MRPQLLRRLEEVVWVDSDRMSGAPCFKRTRIPIQMLIEHLAAGFSPDQFLETALSLERMQAPRFLELAGEQMQECASSLTNARTRGSPWTPQSGPSGGTGIAIRYTVARDPVSVV